MPPEADPDPTPAELDPARLAELPSNERLKRYKEYLREEEARVRAVHDSGGGGCEVASLRSGVIDHLMQSLFGTALVNHSGAGPIALIAN
ncbi:MAG: hypothetical protein VCA35_11790, partial [Roseibacillus sp.]